MDTSSLKHWKDLIKQERMQRNWRQQDVADHLGTTVVTIKRWERGSQQPSAYFRVKLCALFGKSAEELGFLQENLVASEVAEDASSSAIFEPENYPPAADRLTVCSLPEDQLKDLSAYSTSSGPKESGISERMLSRRNVLLLGAGGIATAAALWFVFHRPVQGLSSDSKLKRSLRVPLSQRSYHLVGSGISNWVNHLAWSTDGRYLAVASGSNAIVIWKKEQEIAISVYPTLNKWVNDVSWSSTNWIAAATAESGAGSLQLWKFPEPVPTLTMKKDYALRSVSWSPDGTSLAIAGHSPTVEVWYLFPPRLISHYTDSTLGLLGITRVQWSPSGRFLACAADDGTAHVWEVGAVTSKVIYHGHQGRVHDLAWSPDERTLISCGSDQTCQVWDVSTGQTFFVYRGHKGVVEGVGWSPDGTRVASASADRTVHVWSPSTRQVIAVYDNFTSVAETAQWSPDGAWLTIGTDDGVEIWPGH